MLLGGEKKIPSLAKAQLAFPESAADPIPDLSRQRELALYVCFLARGVLSIKTGAPRSRIDPIPHGKSRPNRSRPKAYSFHQFQELEVSGPHNETRRSLPDDLSSAKQSCSFQTGHPLLSTSSDGHVSSKETEPLVMTTRVVNGNQILSSTVNNNSSAAVPIQKEAEVYSNNIAVVTEAQHPAIHVGSDQEAHVANGGICTAESAVQPSSGQNTTGMSLGLTNSDSMGPSEAPYYPQTPVSEASLVHSASVQESDNEGPPKIEYSDNCIKTLDEKLRNLLYQDSSASSYADSQKETQSTESPLSSSAEDTLSCPAPEAVNPSSTQATPDQTDPVDPLEVQAAETVIAFPGELTPSVTDDDGARREVSDATQRVVEALAECALSEGTSTGTSAFKRGRFQVVTVPQQEQSITAESPSIPSTSLQSEKTISAEETGSAATRAEEAPQSASTACETDASSLTPDRELEETSATGSSAPSGFSPWIKDVKKQSSFTKQPSSDSEMSAAPGKDKDFRARESGHNCLGEKAFTQKQNSLLYSLSSPMSSDDESELEDEDLKVELQKLREKHIQEVVSLQAQQNRELQDVYARLRSLRETKMQSSDTSSQQVSPRRPRSLKSKQRSRPQSLSHMDNGIGHSDQQCSESNSDACQHSVSEKKSLFTDDLHKLVDDWAKENAGSLHQKPSLNQIKLNQNRPETDCWNRVHEEGLNRVFGNVGLVDSLHIQKSFRVRHPTSSGRLVQDSLDLRDLGFKKGDRKCQPPIGSSIHPRSVSPNEWLVEKDFAVLLAGFFGSGALLLAYSSARAAVAEAPFGFRSRRNCWRSSGQFHKNCSVTNSSWTSWWVVSARPEVQCSAALSNARMWSVQVSFGPRCRLRNFLRDNPRGVDAMVQTWNFRLAYAFPPVPLLAKVLRKIREEQGMETSSYAVVEGSWKPNYRHINQHLWNRIAACSPEEIGTSEDSCCAFGDIVHSDICESDDSPFLTILLYLDRNVLTEGFYFSRACR
ncbi:unnamed protein product [Ranitomeya imitator]|uniref:Uncharacterized protein n=1 Tax=Ranitomeya imitator TaxID=111125 RepID=A0ABN9LF99_9NEOB|nr:unnamed protein product [Ranitomeya imitator]